MTDKLEVVAKIVNYTDGFLCEARGMTLVWQHGQHNKAIDGTKLIRLTDHESAMANTEPAGSYQKGYDEGRHQGTRHRVAEIQQLEASRAADKARIEELESENEAVKGMLNDAVVDVQALCPDCRNGWLSRHCQDKPYMHEYQAERDELLGLLRDARDPVCEALNGASNERGEAMFRDVLNRIDATLARLGKA
jgi:hypothetical protein